VRERKVGGRGGGEKGRRGENDEGGEDRAKLEEARLRNMDWFEMFSMKLNGVVSSTLSDSDE
jgi:hypothetical protein